MRIIFECQKLAFAWFFVNFSLALLIKVLLIKKVQWSELQKSFPQVTGQPYYVHTNLTFYSPFEENCREILEIMSLSEIILHKTDFAILSFYVSLAELCALLINTFEKLHLINSEANLRPPQHLTRSFLWN